MKGYYMKKVLIVAIALLLSGCLNKTTAADVVEDYLNEFQSLNHNVKKEISNTIDSNDAYSESQKEIYKDILYKQYKALEYEIISEEYDDEKALVKVNISVINLHEAEEDALNYLSENMGLFYNSDNEFDKEKYLTYKLSLMKDATNKVDYEIIFYLTYKDRKWILENPTEDDLLKINGIYGEK